MDMRKDKLIKIKMFFEKILHANVEYNENEMCLHDEEILLRIVLSALRDFEENKLKTESQTYKAICEVLEK